MHSIAITVRDTDLFLIATVVRKATSDVYINWPRDQVVNWKPHTSYHASGQHHHKDFGKAFGIQKKQKPDTDFKNTVNLVAFPTAAGGHTAINIRCDPEDFNEVFEIPVALIQSQRYKTYVYVDLVEAGVDPLLIPGAIVHKQETYKDALPWLVLTLLDSSAP